MLTKSLECLFSMNTDRKPTPEDHGLSTTQVDEMEAWFASIRRRIGFPWQLRMVVVFTTVLVVVTGGWLEGLIVASVLWVFGYWGIGRFFKVRSTAKTPTFRAVQQFRKAHRTYESNLRKNSPSGKGQSYKSI
jgi:hypothetical protein